jgi:hypothetical protein
MPPKTRTPRARNSDAAAQVGAGLPAAPDSAIPYGDPRAAAARKPAGGRRGVPLGLRIPQETFDRLGAVSEKTGITRQRLLTDALEAYLPRFD